jgi:hypothetical protein
VVDDDVAMRETLQGFAGGKFGRRMTQHYATDASGIQAQTKQLARDNEGNHRHLSIVLQLD